MTLMEFIQRFSSPAIPMMVNLNGQIVPKHACPHAVLQDGDILKIVLFMGGG